MRPESRKRIPAVVHVDGSARPQIVSKGDNPLYFRILTVNTSFSVHEEPIINTPEQALRALTENRVDYILTEGQLVLSQLTHVIQQYEPVRFA